MTRIGSCSERARGAHFEIKVDGVVRTHHDLRETALLSNCPGLKGATDDAILRLRKHGLGPYWSDLRGRMTGTQWKA